MSNVTVEIAKGCWLPLESDEMFAQYVILLCKFKTEEQLCFATKMNMLHIQGLQHGLTVLVKYAEGNDLNQFQKRSKFVTSEKKLQ